MKTLLILALILVITVLHGSNAQIPCTCTIGTSSYDLNQLYNELKGVEQIITDDKRNTYFYTPCRKAQNASCSFPYDQTPGVCQMDARATPGWHGLGTVSAPKYSIRPNNDSTSGFLVVFDVNGEPSPTPARLSAIEFICNPGSGVGSGLQPANPVEAPTHSYHLQWSTQYACPTGGNNGGNSGGKGGIAGGWIFIIILIGVMFLYLIIGVAVKKFVFHSNGIELIPNVTFWMALPGLVKDGNLFVVRKALGLCGRGYTQV